MNWKKGICFVTIAALICIIWVKRNIETDERRLEVEKMWNEAYADTLSEPTQGVVILGEQDMWNAQAGDTPTKVPVRQEATKAPVKAEQKAPETGSDKRPGGTTTPDRGEMPTQKPTVPVTQKPESTQAPTRVPQATPCVFAGENVPGVQEGWGKATHPTAQTMSLKRLPRNGEGSVRTDGDTGRTVTVTGDTYLRLYGLYEDETGEVYRHVGVTYLGEEYYGYIPERRITYCEAPPVYSPTPAITSMPTITRVPHPTNAPVVVGPLRPTSVPVATATPLPTVGVVPKATPTAVPKPTATTVPTKVPTATPGLTATPRPTKTPTATPRPTVTPTLTVVPSLKSERVNYGNYDYSVIPDKFNTGATGSLTRISSACVVDGVEYKLGDNGQTLVIDMYYSGNKGLPGEVVIRDKDFSGMKLSVRHASMTDSKRVIRFVNCKFASVSTEPDQSMIDFYFSNCTFNNFNGSEATFTRCFFGGHAGDGMNPFKNVTVRDCYFSGFPQRNEEGIHTDAMQVYGKDGIDAENILFSNCRVEIPILANRTDNSGCINACLMVQLEYSNAKNFLFENCIINGGGYSIYAWDKRLGWELNNVVFRNISIGAGHKFGDVYPHIAETVVFDNLKDTEKLYVASVWKDSAGRVHVSVTNDTAQDRTLLVVTEAGRREFLIPCKKTAEAAGAWEYYDLPIDMDIVADSAGTDWIVCYDGTESAENQIRFVNWGSEPVYRILQ